MEYRVPQPYGPDWRIWANRITAFLGQNKSILTQQTGDESAKDDGILMWSRAGYPVVSAGDAFREIIIKRAVPTSSVGAAGDTAGMVAVSSTHIYVCTAAHDGTANIWARAALTGGAW